MPTTDSDRQDTNPEDAWQDTPVQQPQAPVVPEDDELRREFLQERNKPLYQRAAGGIYDQLKSLGQDAYQAVVGGAQSQYQLGKKFVQNPVGAVQGLPSDLNALQRGTGSNVVGMVQGIARPAYDIATNPENFISIRDPYTAIPDAVLNYLKQQILPPSKQEVDRGVERLRFDKAASAQTEADIAQAKDPELIKSALAGERFAVQAAGLEEGIGALKNYAKQAAKKFAMGMDTGAPMVDLKKTPDKAGSHFAEPIDAIDTSDEKLLSRVAPPQGAVKNTIKTSEAIKRGAMEVFRLDPSPEGSGTVRGTLQTISDNAPDIYQKYLDYGRNAHDVVLDTQPVSVAIEGTLGEAPSEELGRYVQTAKGAYPEQITLPGAIQKLQQVNQELGPLIRTGDTGARFQVLSAEAGALREMIDPAIEKIGGKQAAALRQIYGHMTEYAKALGKTLRKMDNNIPAHLRGSFHDLVGVGEMLSAGVHTLAHGVNPLTAAAALDGVIRLHKSALKHFWTDPDKMLGQFNQNLNKKIYIGQDIKPPEGFLPDPNRYRGPVPPTIPEWLKQQDIEFMRRYGDELTGRNNGGSVPPYEEGFKPSEPTEPQSPTGGASVSGEGETPRGSSATPGEGASSATETLSSSSLEALKAGDPKAVREYWDTRGSKLRDILNAKAKERGLPDYHALSKFDPKIYQEVVDQFETDPANQHPEGYLGSNPNIGPEDLGTKVKRHSGLPSRPNFKPQIKGEPTGGSIIPHGGIEKGGSIPKDVPNITNVFRNKNEIHLSFDAQNKLPKPAEIEAVLKKSGFDAQVVQHAPDIHNVNQGKVSYTAYVRDAEGNLSSRLADKVVNDIFGGETSTKSQIEMKYPKRERMLRAFNATYDQLKLGN